MANKTQPTKYSVNQFLNQIDEEQKRKDCTFLVDFFEELTEAKPVLWGNAIIGFGLYHYTYQSGREGDWFLLGFAPRKAGISLYVYQSTKENNLLINNLGKYKMGKSCINIKQLADIQIPILKDICFNSIQFLKNTYEYETY